MIAMLKSVEDPANCTGERYLSIYNKMKVTEERRDTLLEAETSTNEKKNMRQ